MSSLTDSYQQYQAPEWFSEELRRIGGENPYGDPMYIVRWGMGGEDECLYRAGGSWHVEGQPSFTGYRNLLLGGGTPSWMLMQWQPPINFGTPESFYVSMYDEETGLSDLGEFPYSGKYVLLYNMCWRDMQDGKMHIEGMPLNSQILDLIVPIIMQAGEISWERTKAALKDMQEKDDAADLTMIEDCMRDAQLAFKGPVSYARQGCRTSIIDKKMEQMTRQWNKMITNARSLGRGLSAHSENPTI
jgi:hypothetical protein